jgi:quinoprotein glucose dehydrogenase
VRVLNRALKILIAPTVLGLGWATCFLAVLERSLGQTTPLAVGSPSETLDQPPADSEAAASASSEAEMASSGFRKPAGWEVKLFASEPHVSNPVVITVDQRGRVYVCESFRQDRGVTDNRKHDRTWLLADLAAESVQDRIHYHQRLLGTEVEQYTAHEDRVRIVEDTDGDGFADQATVFADGFNRLEEGTGAGILVRGKQAYYACIPKLWLLSDAEGDGRAEQREVLHDGYGVRVAFRGHDLHGLIIGPDGRLYFSIGDRGYNVTTPAGNVKDAESGAVFRCELDGSHLEVFATGLRNPQELAFDDYGYLFTGDNNSDSGDKARWVNVMEGGDTGWRMMYQYLPDRGPFNREKLWHPFSAETPAYIVPPIENIGDGPSGLTCYPGTGLEGDYANCFFMVDFRGGASNSGIRLIRVQPQGAFWSVERSEQPIWNILATDAEFGPDGALWVSDWVNGWVGEQKGRIYRFLDTAAQQQQIVREVQELLAAGFGQLENEQLASLLSHLDRRIRLEAQWELAQRKQVQHFQQLLDQPTAGTLPKLHAVWGLGQAARLQPELRETVGQSLQLALGDQDLDVRATAASVVGDLRLESLSGRLVGLIGDSEPRVQYAACMAVGKLQLASGLLPTLAMLEANHDRDPGLRHAGIMALRGIGARHPQELVALKQHASQSVRLASVVALRKLHHAQVAEFLQDAAFNVQLEAIRAVHDVPELRSGLVHVAELLPRLEGSQSAQHQPALHRALNANYRLGTQAAAEAVARFAASSGQVDALRIEAIEMLGSWGSPGQLDRVMNRYDPLADRSDSVAKAAFTQRLGEIVVGSEEVLTAAIAAAVKLKVEGVASSLRQFATDSDRSPSLRAHALAGLVKLEGNSVLELVSHLASDLDPLVRAQALTSLATLDEEAALPYLKKAIASEIVSERQQAWDTLAGIDLPRATQLIEQGLSEYLLDKQPSEVWLNIIEAAEGRVPASSIAELNRFEQQLIEQNSLAAYRDCASGGDPQAGKELFFNKAELSCVRCHKVAGTGGEVGPDLTSIGQTKDMQYLLQSIVEPDAKIAENFATLVLLTDDGQVLSGILKQETDTLIELIDAEGKLIQVHPDQVESRQTGKSSMPVDLLKHLTRRELRDLVAFLASLTEPRQQ